MGDAAKFSRRGVLDIEVSGGGVLCTDCRYGMGFAPASPLGRCVRQVGWHCFTGNLCLVHSESRIRPRARAVRGDLVRRRAFGIYDLHRMEIQTYDRTAEQSDPSSAGERYSQVLSGPVKRR